jgi:outer membrane protein assembly factor BamA
VEKPILGIALLKFILSLVAGFIGIHFGFAQQVLWIKVDDIQPVRIDLSPTLSAADTLQPYVLDLQLNGYLAAHIDTIYMRGDSLHVGIHRGERYTAFRVEGKRRGQRTQPFVATEGLIRAEARKTLKPYENDGYPFATAQLNFEALNDSTLIYNVEVNAGPLVLFDSLSVRGKRSYHRGYFEQYLNIRSGRRYNEAQLQAIRKKIDELPFVRLTAPPQVVFREGKADVYLQLEDVRANRFDGIIGFQPDAETGRPVFTGDLNLALENAFRRGESIEFQWRRLQEQTQNLQLKGALPYLLNTRIGVWGEVELYRRDSTFSTSEVELALGYVFGSGRYLRTFVSQWRSNSLQGEVLGIDDVALRRYGLAWQNYQLDNRINPSKGFSYTAELAAGLKDLTLVNSEGSNETQRLNQFSGQVRAAYWVPLIQRLSLIVGVQGAFKADSTLRLNEHYRMGGLNTLRGFDEESIFASSYGIGTVELKYILDQSSAFFLFYDQGWYERISGGYFTDRPFGFGAGALIGTENSTFRIYYALGKEQGNPVLLRNGKVHFGFINRF